MINIETRVDALLLGDIWVGNDNVRVLDIDHEGGVTVLVPLDYRRGTSEVVEMQLVRFQGTILSGDDQGLTGWWSLRPDQIVEVLRAQ